jgi:hypothetical protein
MGAGMRMIFVEISGGMGIGPKSLSDFVTT